MTLLAQIAAAMRTALNDPARPAGIPTTSYWTGISLEADQLPFRWLAWLGENTERVPHATSPLVRRRARFIVQDLLAGTGSAGQTPQEVGEAFRAWSVRALVANRYLDVDGKPLAIDTIEMQTEWDLDQGEEPFMRMSHHFDVTFSTRANDAELRA